MYQLVEGPSAGQTFYGSHKIVCTNPTCSCTDLLLVLRRHNDEQKSQRSEEAWDIVIDVETRTISRERTSSEAADHIRFAEAFVSHLSEAHWNVFRHDLLQQRQALLDDATYLESAYFDFTDLEYTIEHESAMVLFDTVFPFGRAFDLEVHGTRVTLADQYCLNSRCTCTDVNLSAFPPFGSLDGTNSESINPLFTVSHNYRTHKAAVLDDLVADSTQAATSDCADLYLQAPKADLKRISALVKKRHRILRSVYQAYRKRTGTRGVAGLIIAPIDSRFFPEELRISELPIVLVDRQYDEHNRTFVGINNFESGAMAFRHLEKKGCSRIGFIGYPDYVYSVHKRALGYKAGVLESKKSGQPRVLVLHYDKEDSFALISDFIRTNDFDGLICATSDICYETISVIHEMEIAIPESIQLLTYDDNKWLDYLRYPVSVISQPTAEIGAFAVEKIIRSLNSPSDSDHIKTEVFFDVFIIDR